PSALLFLRGCSWFTLLPRSLLVLIDAVVLVHSRGLGLCSIGLVDSLLILAIHRSLLVIPDMVSSISRSCALERYGLADYLTRPPHQ
ncbi:hypothetical protein BC629DRAFT_1457682, partial [Irpex lacteus]